MANKVKELEEQLIGLKRENAALKIRVEQAEKDLAELQGREEVITETMAAAVQYRKDAEKEAEKLIASMTQNAEKSAKATMENAQNESERIISLANARADVIIDEANKKALEIVAQAEVHTKESIRIAKRESDKTIEHTTAVNTVLISAAAELFRYITAYKEIYEKVAESVFGDLPELPGTDGEELVLPDSYENPAQLFHAVMALRGRKKAVTAVQPEIPDSVPMTEGILDLPDTTGAVEGVLDLEHTGTVTGNSSNSTAEEVAVQGGQVQTDDTSTDDAQIEQTADNSAAEETESTSTEAAAGDASTDDAAADSNSGDELESMLTCIMSGFDESTDNDASADKTDDAQECSGGSVQPSDAENLRSVLSSLFDTDDDGEGVEG